MVHDAHDSILVPPLGLFNAFDLSSHDDDLASWDELAASVGSAQVLGHTGWRDISIQGLGHAVDKLGALALVQHIGRAGGEDKVAIEVDHKSIRRGVEQSPALGSDTQNIGTRLLNQLLDVTGVNHGDVQTTPLVDANAVANGFRSDSQHRWVVTDENDAASRRDSSLDHADNVGDGQTSEQWPHGKVLEAGGRRGELIAQGVILHINADQVVKTRGREAEDTGDLLGVEQVGGLVPVDPHATEVVTQQIVEGIPGEEAQAVRNPVGLVRVIIEVRLRLLAQLADCLCALLVGTGPNAQRDTVQSVRRVLLQDERVVCTVRLALAGTDLHVVREACSHSRV